MKSKFLPVLIIFGLLWHPAGITLAEGGDAQKNVTELTMGVFPRHGARTTQMMFTPLAEELSRLTGIKIALETTHDFASFWENVTRKRYDIVHYNQYHYMSSHKHQGYRVILQNAEFGSNTIAGAIVVRTDSEIENLLDLKGKKVVFGGGRRAMMAYITATWLLRNAGLKEGDYFEQFALNPPKAVIAAYYRQAAAAGSGNHILELLHMRKQLNTDEMKHLAVSEEMAHLPWAVGENLPDNVVTKIKSAMLGLSKHEKGQDVLAQAQITEFIPATDADYNKHRQIVNDVLGEKY